MDKTIGHILSDAVDGPGIAYWAKARNVKREGRAVVSFEVADNAPDGDPVRTGWRIINERAIRRARELLVNGDIKIDRSYKAQFVGPSKDWDYDSEGVDALIQVAFFGEIIYS